MSAQAPGGGHGHVVPRPDGAKARCGGPALCSVCAKELAAQTPDSETTARVPAPPGWKDDWLAILAYAAYTGRPAAAEAFAAWAALDGEDRVSWRAVADAVQMAVRHRDGMATL